MLEKEKFDCRKQHSCEECPIKVLCYEYNHSIPKDSKEGEK